MYLTVSEAARFLSITENAVRNRVKRGSLPAVKAKSLADQRGQQVLAEVPLEALENRSLKTKFSTNLETKNSANNELDNLEVVIAYQKRRIDDLQAERKRLNDLVTQQLDLLAQEARWREALQEKIDLLLSQTEVHTPAAASSFNPMAAPGADGQALQQARAELENQLKPALSRILEALAKLPSEQK
ncbi:MAG: helix-turn-helix domain-containing protein [Pseudomonadota bacterium]